MENGSHHWNDQNESLLKQWGERASVLRILHSKSSRRFRTRATLLTLPTIILSTIAGSLQLRISGDDVLQEMQSLELMLAFINLVIAINTGISSLLRYQERSEAHRSVSAQFGNFYRQISCELAFPRSEREPPNDLLKATKRHYDSLLESSPDIPQNVINNFKADYKKRDLKIAIPDICNGLDPIKVCRNSTYSDQDTEEKCMI